MYLHKDVFYDFILKNKSKLSNDTCIHAASYTYTYIYIGIAVGICLY